MVIEEIDKRIKELEHWMNREYELMGRVEKIESVCDMMNAELTSRVQSMWWMDNRISNVIYNLNSSLDEIIKEKETKRIMKEAYNYDPRILARIELFGLGALTRSENNTIFKSRLICYLRLIIDESWPKSSNIDFDEMTLQLDDETRIFYYSRVDWYGFHDPRLTGYPYLENILTTAELVRSITVVDIAKYHPRGIFIVPEIKIELK